MLFNQIFDNNSCWIPEFGVSARENTQDNISAHQIKKGGEETAKILSCRCC